MHKHTQTPNPIGVFFYDYLSTFSPVVPSVVEAHQKACQTYGVLSLKGDLTIGTSGHLVIESEKSTKAKQFSVSFKKIPADTDTIQAALTMSDDPLKGLMNWNVKVTFSPLHPELVACSTTYETGQIEDNTIVIQQRNKEITYKHTNCVHTQWTLPDVFSEVKTEGKAFEFDLLHNAQVFKPDQELTYEGEVVITVEGGQTVTMDHYLHLGYGTLPTSYLVDSCGVTQIVTGGVNTLALISMAGC